MTVSPVIAAEADKFVDVLKQQAHARNLFLEGTLWHAPHDPKNLHDRSKVELTMTNKDGSNRHTHDVSADAKITSDGKEVKLDELKEGYFITVTTNTDDNDKTIYKIDLDTGNVTRLFSIGPSSEGHVELEGLSVRPTKDGLMHVLTILNFASDPNVLVHTRATFRHFAMDKCHG